MVHAALGVDKMYFERMCALSRSDDPKSRSKEIKFKSQVKEKEREFLEMWG